MAREYERKNAEQYARKVVRSAVNEWRKYHTVSIDTIIRGKGFDRDGGSLYRFKRVYWNGSRFLVTLDTYNLLIGHDDKITYRVEEF